MNQEHLLSPRHKTDLNRGVTQALGTWTNERYDQFLRSSSPGKITKEWFHWFVVDWKVARTIKKGRQESVRQFLDFDFRSEVLAGRGADAVDAAAVTIQKREWSARSPSNGKGVLPISIVSKIGFFMCPSELVPYDSYALKGLNKIRRLNGAPNLKGRCYREYLDAFNELFARMEPELAAALKRPEIIAMAKKLGCPAGALRTIAMRRKLLDDYLMHSGDYETK